MVVFFVHLYFNTIGYGSPKINVINKKNQNSHNNDLEK